MPKRRLVLDFVGKKFGRLSILKDAGTSSSGQTMVLAICECGKTKEYVFHNIKRGFTKSCGCWSSEIIKHLTHGLRYHPLYGVWDAMIGRCYRQKDREYKNYGGIGVTVSDRWRNNFKAFYDWAIDKWEPGLQLDKDVRSEGRTGNFYCPELCCFLTSRQNCRNKSNNRIIEYNGESLCMAEWAERYKINKGTLFNRLQRGWTIEEALETELKERAKV